MATINNAAINIGVHISFPIHVSFGQIPSNGITESYGNPVFFFEEPPILFSIVTTPVCIQGGLSGVPSASVAGANVPILGFLKIV